MIETKLSAWSDVIMSGMEMESPEKISDLPIFPLATVLFPGAVLPLHIFEERYKQMIRHAIERDGLFGLSYFEDAEVDRDSLPDIGSTGCVAKIKAVMPLEEGRMNIVSSGVIRYRVRRFTQLIPFLIAEVETFTDDLEIDPEITEMFSNLYEMARSFLAAAQVLDESGAPASQNLPEDPEAFSLLIASILPLDNNTRQNLLVMTSTKLRLTRLRQYISNLISNYSARLKIQEAAKSNGHGELK